MTSVAQYHHTDFRNERAERREDACRFGDARGRGEGAPNWADVPLPRDRHCERFPVRPSACQFFYGLADLELCRLKAVLRLVLHPADGTFLQERSRSEEHTSELQSLMRISYAVFSLKKKTHIP